MNRARIKRAQKTLAVLLTLGVLIPFVVYNVPAVVGAEHSFVVLSGSMEPTMSPGDAVIVNRVDPEQLESGDVVTFWSDEGTTTHRIVEVQTAERGLQFVTKGDANEQPDARPVQAMTIVGEVQFVIPYIGYVVRFVNTPLGFGLLVLAPLLGFLGLEVRSLLRNTRELEDGENSLTSRTETEGSELPVPKANPRSMENDDTLRNKETIIITRADVRFTLVLTLVYVPYSLWMVYNRIDPVSVAVALSSLVCLLFILSLLVVDRTEGEQALDAVSIEDSPEQQR